ncbi:hypothetical protein C0J52_27786 [Blattella germanica]|nr:hypothetical protein C0J52_27786 [Blattella germanica]
MEAANKQYSELTTKYRDLLQKEQTLVCESRLAARLEGELAVLQKDKEELQNALQQAREKVHSLEVLIEAVNKDMISLLSKKLATIELKELGERQRADHADKMYHILKGQLTQLEERNAELETQNSTLVQQNLDLQQLERDLRDNLLTFIELKLEKDRLKEISDIAQEQIRNLELWKLSQEYQLDYMRRQILELQSTSDERSVIAKLNHELLSSRLSESASHKKVQQLQNEISKLRSHNLRQEELKSRRQAEILQSQLQQAEERLHRLEDHIATLEQQQISTERNWEQAQLSWEQMQVIGDCFTHYNVNSKKKRKSSFQFRSFDLFLPQEERGRYRSNDLNWNDDLYIYIVYARVGAKVMAIIFFLKIPVWLKNVTYKDERTRC